MDRTTTIIRYQWRAYWRRLSRGGKVTSGNQGIGLLILVLVFVRYLQWLRLASISLSLGKTALLEALLSGIFFAWLFPLAGSSQTSMANQRWLHLPLSFKELFRVRVISLFIPPSSWLVFAASLTICYPLAHARKPFAGIVAALLFITTSALIGLTVSHLISIARCRKILALVVIALLGTIGLYLGSGKELRSLLQFSTVLPSSLVARAAVGQRSWIAILVLATLTIVAYAAALWSFRLSLEDKASRYSERRLNLESFSFPGKVGGLMAKDCRYFRRLLDVYLGLLAAAAGCVYFATAEVPSRAIFLTFLCLVFLLSAAVPFNSFGLDTRSGLDRYSLLPLNGNWTILSKNMAYSVILACLTLPVIAFATWRLGITTGVLGVVQAAALACSYLTWGNWMSVNHPLKMQFFRFASSGGAMADAMAGLVFGSLPGILIIYLLHRQSEQVPLKVAVVVLLFAALYWVSVVRFGRRFEQKREMIARALS